ncbi:hypothetical protein PT974_08218 [Cladobotryum mycophilum]|uniref:Uncharacterized protein n=1 Tax=Cladobotryum mycophilum TaxID=491253 RepID=A0ABR0SDS3_9HYPO
MPNQADRFFPLGEIDHLRREAVDELIISPCRQQVSDALRSYGLPEACEKYSDICQQAMSKYLGSRTPNYRAAMRLHEGISAWPMEGHMAVMVPLSNQPQDIVIEVRIESPETSGEETVLHYVETWMPNRALYLHQQGLLAHKDIICFVYLLYPVRHSVEVIQVSELPKTQVSEEMTMEVSDELKTQVTRILRKFPQGEEDWDSSLPSFADVMTLRGQLTLDGIAKHANLDDIEEIFSKYIRRLTQLRQLRTEDEDPPEAEFLAIVAIATGDVAISAFHKGFLTYEKGLRDLVRVVNSAIKECYRRAKGSIKLSSYTRVNDYRVAVRRGAQALELLASFLGQRAHELPCHVANMLSSFETLRYVNGIAYLIHQVKTTNHYRPIKQWDSRPISISNLVYENLGRRLSLPRTRELLELPSSPANSVHHAKVFLQGPAIGGQYGEGG